MDQYVELRGNTRVWSSSVGRYTEITQSILINADVGSFCSIAEGCRIGGGGRHPLDQVSTHKAFYSPRKTIKEMEVFTDCTLYDDGLRRVCIQNDVWLGQNCLIFEGVSIGTGAVVAAGAVVTKNIEPYAIVGGVPARLIRYRHNDQLRAALLKSEWWNWPFEKIMRLSSIFKTDEPLTLEKWQDFLLSLDGIETYEARRCASRQLED